MSLRQVDFSKVLNDDQVYDHMMKNYDQLGRGWIVHQWSWMNNVYQAFKDHYKYLRNFQIFLSYIIHLRFLKRNTCL